LAASLGLVRRLALPLAALALAAPARAESVVSGPVADARLAVSAGPPSAAWIRGTTLSVAVRAGGTWTPVATPLPSPATLDALVTIAAGAPTALVRGKAGDWLGLVRAGRLELLARPDRRDGAIGPAGLTLDRRGRPVIAYAVWFPNRKTYLRVIHSVGAAGRAVERITREGFPPSAAPPSAAPMVLPNGALKVVETYVPAAIEWRQRRGEWVGKLLHSTALGVPGGPVLATGSAAGTFAAWTEAFPSLGTITVVLASNTDRARSAVIADQATLGGLALVDGVPEVVANARLLVGDGALYAAHVHGLGAEPLELDGLAFGYGFGGGLRQVLLDRGAGLEYFAFGPPPRVRLTALTDDRGVFLSGSVEGERGGLVRVYRERPGSARELVATTSVEPGTGRFTAADERRSEPVAYRAVYEQAGVPAAGLTVPRTSPPATRRR
jgi:hypothetical protein